MKWIDNLKRITEKGTPGACPECGSIDTDYACSVVDLEKRTGSLDVWCNNCKSAYHVSRMEVVPGLKEGKIPRDLKY